METFVQGWTGAAKFEPDDYRAFFGVGPAAPDLIERRLLHGEQGDDSLGRLLPAEPGRTLDWMTRKAELADGTSPGSPVCSPRTADALVAAAAERHPASRVRLRRNEVSVWPLVRTGLLRSACGLRLSEIAARVGTNTSTVHGRVGTHNELVRRDSDYAACAAAILCDALGIDWSVEPPRAGDRDTVPGTLGGAKGVTR